MSEHKRVEMRRGTRARVARGRIVLVASAIGAVALAVAVGAVIIGTFPKPDLASPAASRPANATSAAVAKAAVSSANVSASASSTAGETSKTAEPAAAKPESKKAAAKPKAMKPAPKKAKPKQAAPVALPLGMKRVLPGSRQLIVATAPKLGSTHGKVRIYNLTSSGWKKVLTAPARYGTNGLIVGTKRRQGTRTTPTGIWWPGEWVWGWHRKAPSGTLMPYRQTTEKVWWSAENNSTYNTWVVSSRRVNGEHLVRVRIQYEYALSTGYNAPPNKVVRGRGTAIFLHVFDPPDYHNGLSAGCIGISRANMIKVFRIMDPDRKPCFAIGTESSGAGSIKSY